MKIKLNVVRSVLILVLFPVLCYAKPGKNTVSVEGDLKFTKSGDSFAIMVFRYGIDEVVKKYSVPVNSGRFKMAIDQVDEPMYIQIKFPSYPSSAQKYLIEPGDVIRIRQVDNRIIYSGPGSFKFTCRDSLTKIYIESNNKKCKRNDCLNLPFRATYEYLDSIGKWQMNYLLKCKEKLGEKVFNLYKIDLLSQIELRKDYYILNSNFKRDTVVRSSVMQSLVSYHNTGWNELLKTTEANPQMAELSEAFFQSIYSRCNIDSFTYLGRQFDLRQYLNYVTKAYSGLLLEKLITKGIYVNKKKEPGLASIISGITGYIKTEEFKSLIFKINSNNTPGVNAYNFSLSDVSGKKHKLSDYKNKVVLIDFWYTGCGGCVGVNKKLKKVEELFMLDSNLVFVSISIDVNKELWLKSIKEGKYTTENRVNLFTNGMGVTYPMISYYSINSYPTILLIDQNGKLCESALDPRKDDGQSLIALIEKQLKNAGTVSSIAVPEIGAN